MFLSLRFKLQSGYLIACLSPDVNYYYLYFYCILANNMTSQENLVGGFPEIREYVASEIEATYLHKHRLLSYNTLTTGKCQTLSQSMINVADCKPM